MKGIGYRRMFTWGVFLLNDTFSVEADRMVNYMEKTDIFE